MQHQRDAQPLPDAIDQLNVEHRRDGINAMCRAYAHGKAGNPRFHLKTLGLVRVGVASFRALEVVLLATDTAQFTLHGNAVRGAHPHHLARQCDILHQRQRTSVDHHAGIPRAQRLCA